MQLNEDAQMDLDTALFLLREAVRYAERGEIGGVSWRIADAAEWLRKAANEQGIEVQGLHYMTGRGNQFIQKSDNENSLDELMGDPISQLNNLSIRKE